MRILFCIFFIAIFPYQIISAQDRTIDSLKKVLLTQKEDTNKVNTLNELSKKLWFPKFDYKNALQNAEEALFLAEKLNFKMGQGNALHNLGAVYGAEHDLPKAASYYEAAIKIRAESGDKKGLAASYKSMGFVFMDMGNYSEALKMQFASLKTNEAIDDKKGIAASYNNIGILYWLQKDYTRALNIYPKALQIMKEAGDKESMNHPYNNIAGIYSDMGNYPEALKNYSLSLKIREEMGDKNLIADSYIGIGIVYLRMNNNVEALNKFNEALKRFTEIGNKYGIADAYGGIGEVNTALKNFTEARDFLNKDLAFYKEVGGLRALSSIYEDLAKLDSVTTNYKSSLKNYKMYILYRDSMENQESTKKFVQTQMQYDFDKKETVAKAEQDKKDAVNKAEIKNQKIIRNFSYAGTLAVFGFAGVGFYRYKKRRKLQSQQEMLNERLRISRELHDDIGSTLGSISIYSEVAKNRSEKNENAEEAISKIGNASRELIDKMSDIVWSMNPDNESFEQLLNRIQVFAAIMLTPHEILYTIYTDEAVKNTRLTAEERKNIYLIYKEAVHNIIKYADCSQVEIKMLSPNNEFLMSIKDNGKGFDINKLNQTSESLGGNGIKNMKARAESMKAGFNIHSIKNTGTTIILKLKV